MEGQITKQAQEPVDSDDFMVGQLTGFSVSSLMQMLQSDSRTTVVEVKGAGLQSGTIFFENGEVTDAACGGLKGDNAVLEMIGWDTVKTRFLPQPSKTPQRTVNNTSLGLLMEGAKRRDEKQKPVTSKKPQSITTKVENSQKGGTKMAGLKGLMKDIADEMDGVIAVGVVGMDGITVAVHNPTGIDMDVISAKFAMVMKLVERSVDDLSNLGNFEENLVQTANSWLLTRFLDKQYYLACIVSREGTLGNVRLVAKKYLEQVQRAL